MQQTKISIGPILFLCYAESLVSSNLNSKQLMFHGAHPNVCTSIICPLQLKQLKKLNEELGQTKVIQNLSRSQYSKVILKSITN